ncbi:2'-5' RNA ligase [Blastococcus saxobsidens]|uniref:RNA 2',3'-cyclic phosphodiesterase n=1 Tax=Blastococcus saxobsidens TaxID=138336 RepID=A0A4Q7YBY1_9ACTN|nr:2'-5' RNA ligase [Blastococcus saxobsidens]
MPARDDLDRALAPLRDAPGAPRWGTPERWHLTLLFLGRVPEAQEPALVTAAAPAVAGTPPMTLRLAGGGRFGSARRPQVAWVGLDGDVAPLVGLAGRLAGVARQLGLPVEDRPFRPHLTLGRWRPGRPADGALTDRLAGYRGPEWPVREVRLWESRLGRTPAYEVVASWTVTTRTPWARADSPGRSRPAGPGTRRPARP